MPSRDRRRAGADLEVVVTRSVSALTLWRHSARALFFEGEPIPQFQIDGVESYCLVGDKLHILYFQNQPAWVDGVLQMRPRPVLAMMITIIGARAVGKLVKRVTDATLPPEIDLASWSGPRMH
ncbi:hypothetical protein SAMN05444161_8309 [Rhizobiales bacterium GAS191]|nr:hypothetical protein SAMN05444161_8309 [Rhizobiales bacterium GAS191]